HVILEEAPQREEKPFQEASSYLLPLSAKTPEALVASAKSYHEWLSTHDEPLHHVAYTTSLRRSHLEHRLCVVGTTKAEIASALGAYAAGEVPAAIVTGKAEQTVPKVVFVFPGQGSQWVGMGRQLYREEPVFRDALDTCDAAIRKEAGFSVVEELDKPEETSQFSDIGVIQPVLFAIEVALAALWRSWGVEPAAVIGHSMGEVAAAFVASALSMQDAAAIICRRSGLLRKVAGKGAMALVELTLPDAEKALAGYEERLSIAVSNGPRSTVIAGDPAALDELLGKLENGGVFCRRVKVDIASHSPQMDPLRDDLLAALNGVSPQKTSIPMRSTVTGERLRGDELSTGYWTDNLRKPVLFSSVIAQWIAEGHTIFVEMSPHPILTPSVEENLREANAEGVALASTRRAHDERQAMLLSLAALHVRGVSVNWQKFFPDGGRVVELPTYPWQKERYWIESTNRQTIRTSLQAFAVSSASNPLVGTSFTSSLNPEARFWRRGLSTATISWLSEHRVQGEVVFPGTAYLECALEAASETLGRQSWLLEDIAFERMMVFGDDEVRNVEVVFLDDGPRKAYRISSQSQSDEAWLRHASGYIQTSNTRFEDLYETPESIATRLPSTMDVAAYYAGIRARGVYHGPPFQGIVELRAEKDEALAKIRLPEEINAEGYVIHPALLDACLQASGALFATSAESGTYVPVGIERLHVYTRPAREVWVQVKRSAKNNETCDLLLLDEAGHVLAQVDGLRSQRIDQNKQPADPLADCVYEVAWRPEKPLLDPTFASSDPWFVMMDRSGFGEGLAARIS
ncbi:MAG TPA: type I polyketide synthase, partial [Polyangium sp.]|nr:type I polyketide synthase [Polyangium sp.]